MFRIKTQTTRDAQRIQTKPHVNQDLGNPQETEPDLPLSV